MPLLHACPTCGCHVRIADPGGCPHCGAARPTSSALPRAAAAVLMGLALAGCDGPSTDAVALYGDVVTSTDDDGDGWALQDGDCDDGDETINPDATETAGDGIDSNCDGEDDT
jgi:hypothetical protein